MRGEFEGQFEGELRGVLLDGRDRIGGSRDGGSRDGDAGERRIIWIVVFSPQGCEEMLRVCGWLIPFESEIDVEKDKDKDNDKDDRKKKKKKKKKKWRIPGRVAVEYATPAARARHSSYPDLSTATATAAAAAAAGDGAGAGATDSGDLESESNDEESEWKRRRRRRNRSRICVMSIGPTTQAYLRDEFGFEVDAVASSPSAEGVLEGLNAYRLDDRIKDV